jgi:hypothetical protein
MLRYRGRSLLFWLGRLRAMKREKEVVSMMLTLIGLGLVAGLIIGFFLGLQVMALVIAGDFWTAS